MGCKCKMGRESEENTSFFFDTPNLMAVHQEMKKEEKKTL